MWPSDSAGAGSISKAIVEDGDRFTRICNACRYCEGFCAVFPAMELRRTVDEHDLAYLANLCHDCRECLYSCQYAPPHEFAVDLPRLMAEARRQIYSAYAWPDACAALCRRQWLLLVAAMVGAPVLLLVFVAGWIGPAALFSAHPGAGGFYAVMSHGAMISLFGVLGLVAAIAIGVGAAQFWRAIDDRALTAGTFRAVVVAIRDALTLKYLDGGGEGCAYPDEVPTHARQWCHHLTFYGFLLCVAATAVAAIYDHVLDYQAPYPLLSVPVMLGCLGGAGLLVGPPGLLWLKRVIPTEAADTRQTGMDVGFLILLWMTAATGFLLLALRESAAMGAVLTAHLGLVAGLFLTLPYGKFVHGIYRLIALVRHAREQAPVGKDVGTTDQTND
ncbi:MAG: tricarballylate utilization 4Fe-4S protein TcuB [Acidobacteriota bacterium]